MIKGDRSWWRMVVGDGFSLFQEYRLSPSQQEIAEFLWIARELDSTAVDLRAYVAGLAASRPPLPPPVPPVPPHPPRQRFAPPQGDLTDPTFADLYIRAAITDSADREPSEIDYTYWRAHLPELVARGQEIHIEDYAWKRLIGWQAEGLDVPPYGPYAQPPNLGPAAGWTTPFVDTP